jgi:hypothetical protein
MLRGGGSEETVVDDEDTAPAETYNSYSFPPNETATLELDAVVRSGPPIDILFFQQAEFEAFEAERRFQQNSGSVPRSTRLKKSSI